MNKKAAADRSKIISILIFFALALFVIGAVLRSRIGIFLRTYTENQVRKQAEVYALLISEKFTTELENLQYIASRLELSLDDMDDLMPSVYIDSGVRQGLLGIDIKALYGDSLDVRVFDGIQTSFRGKKAISFSKDDGLLFTCPVFNGANTRYVLYRLCPPEILGDRYSTKIYDDLGKFCVTTKDGVLIVPFFHSTQEDRSWFDSDAVRECFSSMEKEMTVSVAAAKTFSSERGDMVFYEAEIPGTDFLLLGYVPKSVAAEGIGNITLLVSWVFGLLMLLVMIGAFYLTRASIKILESDELREAKATAEKASRAKSDFLANMSHEIRTPINAVLGMNEMILRESNDASITAYATNIQTAGKNLLGLVNDILDFSRIESGKFDLIPVDYDLAIMITDLINVIHNRAEDKGLVLETVIDKDLPSVLNGDEVRIKQIVTNLLTNAVKYTEKGRILLRMGSVPAEDDPDSILLCVSVEDTGIGIKEEDIPKLFKQFERVDENRNRNIEGTGLGLGITQSLLTFMGSTLMVRSSYGEGSIFSFALKQKVVSREPLGDFRESYKAHMKAKEKYHEKFTAPKARILVVDDNPMNLMVFKSLVKQTGVQIDTADCGDGGIALTKESKYDLIFLDHMMPEKDGIETLREIRQNEGNPNRETPSVCLTANAISGARETYLEAGFDDYLSKPIDPDILESRMLELLPEELVELRKAGEEAEEETPAEELPASLAALKGSAIDTETGLKNSGAVDAYLALLKVFYESIPDKAEELTRFFNGDDIKNYTIKIHALKSSARIIGAAEFGEKAQQLEDAGKAENVEYIQSNHPAFMEEYEQFKTLLAPVFPKEAEPGDQPEAKDSLIQSALEELKQAAEDMDCDGLERIFKELSDYRIPDGYAELFEQLKKTADQFDYDGILSLLQEKEASGN